MFRISFLRGSLLFRPGRNTWARQTRTFVGTRRLREEKGNYTGNKASDFATGKIEEKYAEKVSSKIITDWKKTTGKRIMYGGVDLPKHVADKDSKPPEEEIIAAKMMNEALAEQPPLDTIMNVSAVQEEDSEQIAALWRLYHRGKGFVCDVLKSDRWQKVTDHAAQSPLFVVPLPRGTDGEHEFLYVQWRGYQVAVTTLEEIKKKGDQAATLFTIDHYPEFAESKGIVLTRVQLQQKGALDDVEQKLCLRLIHTYYGSDDLYRHVHNFNHNPNDFDYRIFNQS
eukprot:Clim_evm75s109 gene=Clim_evmTU75s109